jgi:flavin reductase (DIM6/NTAB) family NADH-FMN oxidoreductase RutF
MTNQLETFDAVPETMAGLQGDGLFLMTGETGNPMTIGWGSVGVIWGRQVFTVLVRPSRHSFTLLEALPEFTICVPTTDLRKALAVCGSKSGRDLNKMEACGFTSGRSEHVAVPFITECGIHYECRVLHKTSVINADLDPSIAAGAYRDGDLHRIYHGEILGVYKST